MKLANKAHEEYIKLCFSEAAKGIGSVSPNPLVGAVIVKDNKIIATGYHERYGENHAEINAINNAGSEAAGSTLYLNLEPCSHYGKTPPCVDAIIKAGIKEVVCSMEDPNPLVKGRGFKRLLENGIKVISGVLEAEARELNRHFVKFMIDKQPYINLKIATTLNSKISNKINRRTQITGSDAKQFVYKLRNEYDAVLIGGNTLRIDNPGLYLPENIGEQPLRIVLSSSLDFSLKSKMFNDRFSNLTYIFTSNHNADSKIVRKLEKKSVNIVFVKTQKNGLLKLEDVLDKLYQLNISSVLVEGGKTINSSFLNNGIFDELNIIIAPKFFSDGVKAYEISKSFGKKNIEIKLVEAKALGNDVLLRYRRK